MKEGNKTCVSIFKSGAIDRETYTALWIRLMNQICRDQVGVAPREPQA